LFCALSDVKEKKREVVEEEEDKEKKISVEIDSFCTK
jgi:hypothetical protein